MSGPRDRRILLSHTWTFDVAGGSAQSFLVDAHHTANTEGDDFVFSYSLDDLGYTPMVTVTKTSDDDTLQWFMFTEDVSGTVYVRVEDTDRTAGNHVVDTVFVDEMVIVTGSDCAPADGTVWAVPSPARNLQITNEPVDNLSWDAPAEPGGTAVDYEVLRSESFDDFETATCVPYPGYLAATDGEIPASGEVYHYLIRSINSCGESLGSDSADQPRTGNSCIGE